MSIDTTLILTAAREAHQAGLCVLPTTEDGTKRPAVETWESFQTTRPTTEQMKAFGFGRRSGFGMVAGPVSGHRGSWDFDCAETYDAFLETARHCGLEA